MHTTSRYCRLVPQLSIYRLINYVSAKWIADSNTSTLLVAKSASKRRDVLKCASANNNALNHPFTLLSFQPAVQLSPCAIASCKSGKLLCLKTLSHDCASVLSSLKSLCFCLTPVRREIVTASKHSKPRLREYVLLSRSRQQTC